MGASQSSVHATHFQRPSQRSTKSDILPIYDDEHRISISNKMAERLVDDATVAGSAAKAQVITGTPIGDHKDKVLMEKLKSIDDSHSKKFGLTVDDLNITAARIHLRTMHTSVTEPVCADCKKRVIECYRKAQEADESAVRCWETVDSFAKCVRERCASRVRERGVREERWRALRSKHLEHARGTALKDLHTGEDKTGQD